MYRIFQSPKQAVGDALPSGRCGAFLLFRHLCGLVLRFIRIQRLLDESDDEFFLRDFPAVLLFCGDEILQPLIQLLGDLECESLSFRHGDFSSFEAFFEYQLHIITQSLEAKLFLFLDTGMQIFRIILMEILLASMGVFDFVLKHTVTGVK
ncbi:MAG: hypothetical protein ACLU9S_21990 [Oscillospiraceae bacterium]